MDSLEYAQTMFAGRLAADPYFADIAVLEQRKGVTDADILQALSTLNEKTGKNGACVVVLMPSLKPENSNAPSPTYRIQLVVQVIDLPLFNLGTNGTGKSAEQIAQRVRQLCHLLSTGEKSVWVFSGSDPLPVEEGSNSYGVAFTRQSGDPHLPKVPNVQVEHSGTGPVTFALSCPDASAAIWYTLDGSYPWPDNPAAKHFLPYTAFDVSTSCTLLAVAYRSGFLASNIASATIAVAPPQAPG
jgi:hypothetical protein